MFFAVGNLIGPLTLGRLFDTIGRRRMISGTYILSGTLLIISAFLFNAGALNATTQTICWCVIFFFASAGASAAYLTVSEIFPVEVRAKAIAVFFAIAQTFGAIRALAVRDVDRQRSGPLQALHRLSDRRRRHDHRRPRRGRARRGGGTKITRGRRPPAVGGHEGSTSRGHNAERSLAGRRRRRAPGAPDRHCAEPQKRSSWTRTLQQPVARVQIAAVTRALTLTVTGADDEPKSVRRPLAAECTTTMSDLEVIADEEALWRLVTALAVR